MIGCDFKKTAPKRWECQRKGCGRVFLVEVARWAPCRAFGQQKPPRGPRKPQPAGGPGGELKAMIDRLDKLTFGWLRLGGCGGCAALAREMDRNGSSWCEAHREPLLDKMQANAEKHGAPFERHVVGAMLDKAIRRARKKGY